MADVSGKTRESSADVDLSGRQFDDFYLLRRLAQGAMAEVYLAEQRSLRRQVAFKVLKSELAKDESYVKRFHNEAHAAASLVHANIVQIYAVGCADNIHYIAQEYVQGQNLSEWMNRRGPPEVALAVKIMRQVAAALQKAAERGIVHRDIKPENIMIARTGEVKVADFGLARNSDGASNALTQVGVTMGTPLYMSPEQVEGRPLDPRSDLYSFGVTCYEMLAGHTPFRGDSALAIAVQHLKTQPDRLENIRTDLPPALCRIVHKLLAKDPQGRYASARDLLHDLRMLQLPGETEWQDDDELPPEEREALATIGAATQHLAAVMRTSSMPIIRGRFYVLVALAVLAAFTAGGWLAWETRRPLLASTVGGAQVFKCADGDEQFIVATWAPTNREAWLKSVAKYFPRDRASIAKANQELALFYLQMGRQWEALLVFEELAASPEPDQRAFGLAGASLVRARQSEYQQAAADLMELWPIRKNLTDSRMAPLLQIAVSEVRKQRGQEAAAEWDDWQKSLQSLDAE
jgi:tRNA A-37 threonylcarbamoyl transferase component Bud32